MTLPWDQDVITEKEQLDKSNEGTCVWHALPYCFVTKTRVLD